MYLKTFIMYFKPLLGLILLFLFIPGKVYAQQEDISELKKKLTDLESKINMLEFTIKKEASPKKSLENLHLDLILKPVWYNNGRNRGSGNEAGFDLIADLGLKLKIEDNLSVYLRSRLRSQKSEFSRNYEYEFSLTGCYRPKNEPLSLQLGYLAYYSDRLGDYKFGMVPAIFDIDDFYDYRFLCIGPIDNELIPYADLGIRWDKSKHISQNATLELNLLLTNGEGDAVTDSNSAQGFGGSSRLSFLFNHQKNLLSIGGLIYTGKKHSTPIKELFDVCEIQVNMAFQNLQFCKVDMGDMEIKSTYSWYRRGFRDEEVDASDVSEFNFSPPGEEYLIDLIKNGGVGTIDFEAINIDLKYNLPIIRRRFAIIGNFSKWRDNDRVLSPIKRFTAGIEAKVFQSEINKLTFFSFWSHTDDDLPKDVSDRENSFLAGFRLAY